MNIDQVYLTICTLTWCEIWSELRLYADDTTLYFTEARQANDQLESFPSLRWNLCC